jgi:hypothetical protein
VLDEDGRNINLDPKLNDKNCKRIFFVIASLFATIVIFLKKIAHLKHGHLGELS